MRRLFYLAFVKRKFYHDCADEFVSHLDEDFASNL